jgi:hypothetical protein
MRTRVSWKPFCERGKGRNGMGEGGNGRQRIKYIKYTEQIIGRESLM